MPQLILGALGLWLAVMLVVWVSITLFWLCVNLLVLADQVLGRWPFDLPAASWAWNGFVVGGLLSLAKRHRRYRLSPDARHLLITGAWLWLFLLVIIAMIS